MHRSRSENRVPNLGSRVALDAQSTEFELTFSDPVHEFDAGDRRCGFSEMLEAEHRTEPKLNRSVILFNQIVEIVGGSDLALISLGMFVQGLFGCAM